ncbi:MAG: hypothetical protein KatS3mg099_105 [Candidatus Parcubacteria bacterium]|nr:MAG: hypothetical protein KatS3mg099_105 [Candidatus Parcubacteria bacterium]
MRGAQAQAWVWEVFAPVMALEAWLPTPLRRTITKGVGFATLLLAAVAATLVAVGGLNAMSRVAVGLTLIALSGWLFLASLEWFRRWYYYYEYDNTQEPLATFETAHVLYLTPAHDATAGLLRSYFGVTMLARLGVSFADAEAFLFDARRSPIALEALTLPPQRPVRVGSYAAALYRADKALQLWLSQRGVQEGDFTEAAMLIDALWEERKRAQRWWSREHIGRLPPFGRALSYGQRYILDRFTSPIAVLPGAAQAEVFRHRPELLELENALLSEAGRNVLLVGDAGSGAVPLVAALAQAIEEGRAMPELLDKVVLALDWERMISEAKAGGAPLEEQCATALAQALHAGNILLVVPNLPGFLEAGRTLGVDVVDLLEPYITRPELPAILLVDRARFETEVRPDGRLLRSAALVEMKGEDYASLIWLVWHAVLPLERRYRVPFLIPAIRALAEIAERYLPAQQRAERAVTLAERIIAQAAAQRRAGVDATFVREVASQMFSVPLAAPTREERQTLLALEALLAREVVGQEEAVRVVAQALRRARAGVRGKERPVGSFLFLGPTGVGKTQTAKALAKVLFGGADKMVRFDMTEYRGPDALARLIGDPTGRIVGRLASALRDTPFAVYLLDEFEKTESEVHDLFLQIFDEGKFTDGQGQVVYARDAVFIATSNAASDIVWEFFQKGESPTAHREEIIHAIVSRGIFKPELLNRFDAVVVFHPLSREHIAEIARRMVGAFVERLRLEKGITVVMSDETFSEILAQGYEPRFGARPMRRAVQDILEQKVADAILAQGAQSGATIRV